jgi:nuclear pore complex protein Nup93
MSDFQDLLHDAEQLTAQIDKENSSLPRLQRTLSQLCEVNKRKLAKSSNYFSSENNEINASILLAGKGIDAPRLTQTIETLNIQPTLVQPSSTLNLTQQQQQQDIFSPFSKLSSMEQLRDIDLQSFLKSEKEQALMSIIEETRKRTIQDVEESFLLSNQLEWEKQKQKIMNELLGSFGGADLLNTSNLNQSTTTTTSVLNRTTNPNFRTTLSDLEMEFAKIVYFYNQQIISDERQQSQMIPTDQKVDLLSNFFSLVKKLNDKNLEEAWNTLSFMTNLNEQSTHINRTDYQTHEEYRQNLDRDNSADMQRLFIKQAQTYLEYSFKELIKNTVNANLKQAKLGGNLGTLSLVSGYLRLGLSEKYHQFSSNDEVFDDHQPIWATIYLCLRCGDLDAARDVALKTKKDDIVTYLDEILRTSYLSESSENKLKLEYKSIIRRGNDLFKRAVYCYLCKNSGDVDSINEILDNVDDFLWFKLNLIQVSLMKLIFLLAFYII